MQNHFEPVVISDVDDNQYTLRVHTYDDELPVVAEWVRQNSTLCLIVREMATRAHFHAIFGTRKSIEQWRKNFKKRFPHLEGNKNYSLKDIKSQIGIKDYLCKGGNLGELPHVMERSPSWTDQKIMEHHQSYHSRHVPEVEAAEAAKQGSDSLVSDTNGRTRVRTPTVCEKVALCLQKEYPDHEWQFSNTLHRSIVYKRMMKKLGEAGKAFDIVVLKRLFNGVMHQLCEIESTDHFENMIVGL